MAISYAVWLHIGLRVAASFFIRAMKLQSDQAVAMQG